MLTVANRWWAISALKTGDLNTGSAQANLIWKDLSATKADVDTSTFKGGYLKYPTGTAVTNLGLEFHLWAAVEDYAFRNRHAIEMPDLYEYEFISNWMNAETADNFNLLVKFSVNTEWIEKFWTHNVRNTKLR